MLNEWTISFDQTDIQNWIDPPTNDFCKYYGFPIFNTSGFNLYFAFIPEQNATIGFGLASRDEVNALMQTTRTLYLIAFSSMDNLRAFFPRAEKEDERFGHYGVPMRCAQAIMPLPANVPASLVYTALANPNTIISQVATNPAATPPPAPAPLVPDYKGQYSNNAFVDAPILVIDPPPVQESNKPSPLLFGLAAYLLFT